MIKNKTIIVILTIFTLSLLAISAVSAADDGAGEGLSAANEFSDYQLTSNDELTDKPTTTMENNNDDGVSAGNEDNNLNVDNSENIINSNSKTFSDLNTVINGNEDSDIYLEDDYTFNSDSDSNYTSGIIIQHDVTIHGNGHILNASGKARIFNVTSSVTFMDIIFIGGKTEHQGGAIYGWSKAINCTFISNEASFGGAMHNGNAINCTFLGNLAHDEGGAVFGASVENCIFRENAAINNGGALSVSEYVKNCTFIQNTAYRGGAIRAAGAIDCIFMYNYATKEDNDINAGEYEGNCIRIGKGTIVALNYEGEYNSGEKLLFDLKNSGNEISGINISIYIYKDDEIIDAYYSLSGDGWVVSLEPGDYIANLNVALPYMVGNPDVDPVNVTVKVNRANTTLLGENITTVYNGDDYLLVSLKDNLNNPMKNTTLYVASNGNTTNYTTDEYGQINISTTGLVPNTYILNITYEGSKLYLNSTASFKITVDKANTILRADNITVVYNKDGNLLVILKDNKNKPMTSTVLSVKMEGMNSTNYTTNDDGQINISTKGLLPDTYIVNISYGGSNLYSNSSATSKITVNKDTTKLIASKITTIYNVNKNLIVKLTDSIGNLLSGVNLTVKINGVKKYTTGSNGQVNIPTKDLTPKAYTVNIIFGGNDCYINSTSTSKITVNKASPKMTANAKRFKRTVKTKKYTITLKNNINKPISKVKISLKVKGKTYQAKTNSKGRASFKITNLIKKGKFTATVKFAGDKYYKAITKKVKITII